MKRLLLALLIGLIPLPALAQDDIIEPIPVCTDEQLALIPILLIDSGFFLDYALISFGPIGDTGEIDYLVPMLELLSVRDVWIEAIQPNFPNCVQSVEFQILMGDYLDQGIIMMLSSTVSSRLDESYTDRADVEEARLQGIELELNAMFEILFADIDIEEAVREQMEAREADG